MHTKKGSEASFFYFWHSKIFFKKIFYDMDFFCQVIFPLYIVIHGKGKKKKSHHQNLKRSYLMKKIFKQLMSQCVFIEL